MSLGKRAGAGLLAAVVLLTFPGCGGKERPGPDQPTRPVVSGVEVRAILPSSRPVSFEAIGTVQARTVAAVAPQVMGRITALPVSEGSRVEKGALIATIDDAAIKAEAVSAQGMVAEAEAAREEAEHGVSQARAARVLAETTYDRFAKLSEEKVISRQEFDEVEAKRTVAVQEYERAVQRLSQAAAKIVRAQGQSNAAQAMLSYTRVTAPFSGVVTEKKADAGSMAVPGTPIVVLEDTSRYRIEAAVPETYLAAIRVGTPVEVALDSVPGQAMSAKVSEVVPAVDPASRTFVAKVDVAGARLRTGLSGRIRFAMGEALVLSVPRKAISRAGGYDGVFVVTPDNVARLVIVRTGREMGDAVEVLSGLAPGSRVAITAVDRLVDGAKAEIRP